MHPARLRHGRALIDTTAIGNHDGHHQPGVFATPPARCPIAAALFLECPIAEKTHQLLPRQWHVDILQASETEIAALADTTGGIHIHMTPQGRNGPPIGADLITVEILAKLAQPLIGARVSGLLFRLEIAHQDIHGIDRRHTVPLSHHPSACAATQCIGK